MKRRQYVAALGAMVATGLAGCGNNDSPNGGTATPTTTEGTPGSTAPADWRETFRTALEERDIQVDFVDTTEKRLILDYITHTTERAAFVREMEVVATTYAEVAADSWDVETAEIWALDPEIEDPQKKAIASYLVRNEWAYDWQDDAITTDELMKRVLDSIEAYKPFRDRYGDATPTPSGGEGTSTE